MESEYKFCVMHEQTKAEFSGSNNLVISESLHTNHHSSHTQTKLDIKSLTNDNHKQSNQTVLHNNRTLTKATNTVVRGIVDFKTLNYFDTSRHDIQSESATTTARTTLLSYSEDNINNNNQKDICDNPVTSTTRTGVGIMSHNNFVLSFEHQQQSQQTPSPLSGSETLLSPAEAPFGRRYAEISQFKNHPNVEW